MVGDILGPLLTCSSFPRIVISYAPYLEAAAGFHYDEMVLRWGYNIQLEFTSLRNEMLIAKV